ncbi:MAG TPA: cellulase family glycosylhydrolase [Candidatus Limnocylindrales bacterium]|nr:cellulase family glycosylhydrolase [Candidatus Limnocylindrales bacterium]
MHTPTLHHSPGSGFRRLGIFFAALIAFGSGLLQAQLINVNFTLNSSAGSGGPNPSPTMSGAAVLGAAGDQWNGINTNSGNGIPLIYANGSNSTVTMAFTSGGGYNVNDYGGSTPFASTLYNALMENYLYNNDTIQTITLSRLAANSTYNLVLYNAANTAAAGRTTYFTVNGNTRSSTWNGSSSTLIAGVDYVEFASALSDGSGNLAITYTGAGTAEGDINGFQIQDAPFTVSASYNNTNVLISFLTQSGLSYQLQYKNNLTDTNWTPVGISLSGNNAVQSVADLAGGSGRFYRVQISANAVSVLSLLHTSGTNLVNASGAAVQLKGLNLGGWFIMEKWMCPLDSGSMPDTYSVITNLDGRFGVATEQSLIRTYQTNWITIADLDNITNGGYNCVRVPVWWGNFYSITNTTSTGWRSDAFTVLDWLVANCAARGIYVVIDMHGVIGGQSTNDTTGQQYQNLYWASSTDQSQTAYLWTQIATHYNGNNAVAGYDLINEPTGAPNTAAVWTAYNSLYDVIRSVDPGHIIIMEGTFGSWNWSMLPSPSLYGWTNVAYSMHEYQWGGSVAQCETGSDNQVTDFNNHKSWNVPDYIGEWNDMGNGAACYDYSISDYNNDGISWTMWTYKTDLASNGWGWYDPIRSLPTPNISSDSSVTISNDWSQWKTTTTTFGVNSSVGL